MRTKLALTFGLAAATLLAPQLATAAPVTPGNQIAATPLVETVRDGRSDWHRHSFRRNHDGHRFGRWHRFNRCRLVRHSCADRFGWGNWRYQRCTWHRGC